MTPDERKKQAAEAATQLITDAWRQAAAAPPQQTLTQQLEFEHRRAIERAKKREAEFRNAFEAAVWMCTFCQTVYEPKILEFPEVGRRVVQRVEFCECDHALAERSRRDQAGQEQEQAIHLAYLETLELWQKFNTEWPDGPTARAQLAHAKQKVWEWYASHSTAGLVLAGGFGCGKSHLLRAVVRAYGLQGAGVAFYNEPEILSVLTGSDAADRAAMLRKCKTARVLVLDDIGSREFDATSRWAKHMLESFYFQILERREGMATLFSTNYYVSDLAPVVGERAFERMHDIIGSPENIINLWDVSSYRRRGFR